MIIILLLINLGGCLMAKININWSEKHSPYYIFSFITMQKKTE